MSRRRLKPDEQRAWARVARSVRALPGQTPPEETTADNVNEATAATRSSPAQQKKKPALPSIKPPATPPRQRRAPIQNRGQERRVRRGQTAIAATLDLHGHTQDSARRLLVSFLSSRRRQSAACVLVITGKGRLGEGALRRQLLQWLGTAEARALVNGYAEAHRKHGGSGAWYIFLRKYSPD